MFDNALEVVKFFTFIIGFGTYICQWGSLMYEIIDGEVKSKREIVWKVIPFGFLLLIVWKWQELSKKEYVYDAEVVNEDNGGEEKCLKNI